MLESLKIIDQDELILLRNDIMEHKQVQERLAELVRNLQKTSTMYKKHAIQEIYNSFKSPKSTKNIHAEYLTYKNAKQSLENELIAYNALVRAIRPYVDDDDDTFCSKYESKITMRKYSNFKNELTKLLDMARVGHGDLLHNNAASICTKLSTLLDTFYKAIEAKYSDLDNFNKSLLFYIRTNELEHMRILIEIMENLDGNLDDNADKIKSIDAKISALEAEYKDLETRIINTTKEQSAQETVSAFHGAGYHTQYLYITNKTTGVTVRKRVFGKGNVLYKGKYISITHYKDAKKKKCKEGCQYRFKVSTNR
jgi:hypothetical protein